MSDQPPILGIPEGYKIVRVGLANKGDTIIGCSKTAVVCTLTNSRTISVIIEPIVKPDEVIVLKEYICWNDYSDKAGHKHIHWGETDRTFWDNCIPTGVERTINITLVKEANAITS